MLVATGVATCQVLLVLFRTQVLLVAEVARVTGLLQVSLVATVTSIIALLFVILVLCHSERF